jgi:hypothetical protein
MNWARWGTKGSEKTREMTPGSEIMHDDHLKNLMADVRPLSKGESVMRLLQQGALDRGCSGDAAAAPAVRPSNNQLV